MNKNKVVVIGSSHHNTLGVIRSLGEKGLRPYLLLRGAQDAKGVHKSRYIEKWWLCHTDSECLNILLREFKNEHEKPVVISTTDPSTQLLDEYRHLLEKKFYLPICLQPNKVVELMDKSIITETAKTYNINTPRSWIIRNRNIPSDILFPCLAKPLSSLTGHKSDICECNDIEELRNQIFTPEHCEDYLVQERIQIEKEISILGMVTYDRSEVLFSGCIDKLRTAGRGSSSFAVMISSEFFSKEMDKLREMLLDTGYTGLFSAEYLLYKGKYYFLEINFRNDGNGYVPTAAGINLPYLWYLSCTGVPDNMLLSDLSPLYPCYFMSDITDFLTHVMRKKLAFKQWNKERRKTKCFLLYNSKDNAPFWYCMRKQVADMFRKAAKFPPPH